MNIVYLPGLETDERLFFPLKERFGGSSLQWLEPVKNETLSDYAKRIAEQISMKENSSLHLVGLCFGGVVAMEIAQHIEVKSIVTMNVPGDSKDIREEFRNAVQIGSKMPLTVLKGLLAMKGPSFYQEKEELNDEQTAVLSDMMKGLNMEFLRWAAVASAEWNQPTPFEFSCPHLALHGGKNQIIKTPKVMKTERLQEAGHLIPLTHFDELSSRLEQFWKNLPDL